MMQEHRSRITSKGQITLPAEIRRSIQAKPGDMIVFTVDNGRITVEKDAGIVARIGKKLPTPAHLVGRDLDEIIDEAAEDAAVSRYLETRAGQA